jgi:glycyl-radical enzyme activating protein
MVYAGDVRPQRTPFSGLFFLKAEQLHKRLYMESSIFNIQRFSIHDGPGIRTTVFFKGCNLRCFWCHNPESWVMTPQIQYFPEKCILCGKCVEVCPTGSQQIVNGVRVFDRDLCNLCGKCVDVCYAKALVFTGEKKTVQEIIEEVKKDHLYYKNSGGGVTFSGGEPLLQVEFLVELLKECKGLNFHTAIDTAGNVSWEQFEAVLPYTDLFLYDFKAFLETKHRAATGVGNQKIIENLIRLNGRGVPIYIRIPVIPGVNDMEDEMEQIGATLEPLKSIQIVELLPFHHLGSGKYRSLGMEYPTRDLKAPDKATIDRLARVLGSHNLNAKSMA